MPAEVDPIIATWYCHLKKGQRFFVVAVDESARTVEVQDFDGTVNEFELDTWYELDIEVCAAPENWSGPLDIGNVDDLGTEITDTRPSDWNEPLNDFEPKADRSEEE
ncbi:MAG: hypothetical protein KAT93_08545 [Desulfuromonadales bacterium]|jgi:hypothetical protein|nr:hypothetical protein [Desulfuromonadales bacterium]